MELSDKPSDLEHCFNLRRDQGCLPIDPGSRHPFEEVDTILAGYIIGEYDVLEAVIQGPTKGFGSGGINMRVPANMRSQRSFLVRVWAGRTSRLS